MMYAYIINDSLLLSLKKMDLQGHEIFLGENFIIPEGKIPRINDKKLVWVYPEPDKENVFKETINAV